MSEEPRPGGGAVPRDLAHRLVPMSGRDPHETGRTATPLELFFDLTFVIAISVAASELAHSLTAGHIGSGILAFAFCLFAIMWAWVNFSWFASAYDTDDWLFRVMTMLQMVGVLIVAMGIHDVFASIDAGGALDNEVLVGGYVVMRVAMILQWLRAARQDSERRRCALTYVAFIGVAQVGWVAMIVPKLTLWPTLALMLPLYAIELAGPYVAERRSSGTPWHAHHIAERYGLIVIIALGECLIGTVAALQSVVDAQGWSWEVAAVGVAGVGIAFTMWWIYFAVPMGTGLHHRRETGFIFGYGHIVVVAAVAATGAGLHVAANYLQHTSHLPAMGVLSTVLVPMLVFWLSMVFIDTVVVGRERLHVRESVMVVVVLLVAVLLTRAHVALTVCLLVAALAFVAPIVMDERVGARLRARALAGLDR
jgi:low temperature requirement protein LtrA